MTPAGELGNRMFSRLRDPRGGYSLLMAGIACFLLAGFAGPILPFGFALPGMLFFAIAGLVFVGTWWSRRRSDPYDLRKLWDEEPPEPEEPLEDTVPEDSTAPYCGWCDEAYPPGTGRCHRCGRVL
jgi:hypothetical protein